MSDLPAYKVTALREGTVIDHLPPGTALKALEVLGNLGGGVVTVGMFLESKKLGKKDLIKIEAREITPEERAKIALFGTHTTISIIRNYRVVEKTTIELPREITGVVRCPNPSCVTNHDPVTTRFHVERTQPLEVRCHHCERIVPKDEVVLR